jgi:hypothetical protein
VITFSEKSRRFALPDELVQNELKAADNLGFLEKQNTRTPFDRTQRACRDHVNRLSVKNH